MTDDAQALAAQESDARDVLAQQLAGWPEKYPNVVVRQELAQGWPAEAILQYGRDMPSGHQPQLIVVGSHGRGPLASLFLSSTSQALMSAAPWPVLVAHSPGH